MSRRQLLTLRSGVTSFPVVESVTTGVNSTAGTSSSYGMPTTVDADDLLVLIGGEGGASSVGGVSLNDDLGTWTEAKLFSYDGNFGEIHVWILRAAGTEGGGTETGTSTANRAGVYHIWRISGAYTTGGAGTAWDVSTGADTGTSSTPDPDSVTASWGSDKNLYIPVAAGRFSSPGLSIYPTDYDDNQTTNTSNGERLGTCSQNVEAASDNPGSFTLTGTVDSGGALTLVVRPAAA